MTEKCKICGKPLTNEQYYPIFYKGVCFDCRNKQLHKELEELMGRAK